MNDPAEIVERVGIARGEHAGLYVWIERELKDPKAFHIYLLESPPDERQEGVLYDIWADDFEQVLEWIGPDNLDVNWSDETR